MFLQKARNSVAKARDRLAVGNALKGPHMLAFLPASVLAGFWIGGETTLFLLSIGLPLLFLVLGDFSHAKMGALPPRTRITDLMEVSSFREVADHVLRASRLSEEPTACLLLEVAATGPIAGLYGEAATQAVRDTALQRLRAGLRRHDEAVRIGDARFGVLLQPDHRLSLEVVLQLAGRLQEALEEPIAFEKRTLYPSVSVGFCLSTHLGPDTDGKRFFEAALIALEEALMNGPSALRAYSQKLKVKEVRRHDLIKHVPKALSKGEIQPWFQPQVSTDDGRVSGLEALARWVHPDLGMIAPGEFLPTLEASGNMGELGTLMISQSLTALKKFDELGFDIPHVGVNLCSAELCNPSLLEKIRWELDLHSIEPHRLCIEVVESVISDGPDGIISRNLRGICAMGCLLDLDDFGTGQASLSALRAFDVHRIKIDRSFVSRVDRDPEQQRMIAAIVSMADQLGLTTVAEGVETAGEHAILAQLGCRHVQGFALARPMPATDIPGWVQKHAKSLGTAPDLSRRNG